MNSSPEHAIETRTSVGVSTSQPPLLRQKGGLPLVDARAPSLNRPRLADTVDLLFDR